MRTQRPEVLSLLCVLQCIGSLFYAIAMAGLARNRINAVGWSWPFASILDIMLIHVALVAALAAVSAKGMWKGRKWGWHLGLVLYSYLIMWFIGEMALGSLFAAVSETAVSQLSHPAQLFRVAAYLGRIGFCASVLAYLILRNAVASFCGLPPTQTARSRARFLIAPSGVIVAAVLVLLRLSVFLYKN